MTASLYLNVSFATTNADTQLGTTVELTPDSAAVLSLISYLDLKVNVDLQCICVYSQDNACRRDIAVKTIIDSLASRFAQFCFVAFANRESHSVKNEANVIFVSAFGELCDQLRVESNAHHIYLSDVNRPLLVKQMDKNECSIAITGLASIFRNVVKIAHSIRPPAPSDPRRYLLGFRNNCLKACAEVSKWTYLCESMSLRALAEITTTSESELPTDFFTKIEAVLSKPLELAHRSRKENKQRGNLLAASLSTTALTSTTQRYLEDYFATISDLIVFYVLSRIIEHSPHILDDGDDKLGVHFKRTLDWYALMCRDKAINASFGCPTGHPLDCGGLSGSVEQAVANLTLLETTDIAKETTEQDGDANGDNSTCAFDMEIFIADLRAHVSEKYAVELPVSNGRPFSHSDISLDWSALDSLVSPSAGGLPQKRVERKCQQLENFVYLLKTQVLQDGRKSTVVDFCSGGGHLGIAIAYMFPQCLVKLVENKEESLEMAVKRICELKLSNCLVYKGNLTSFVGRFNVGLGLHACGSMTDLLLEKCIQSQADLLISPCCYGSIKENDALSYPRSQVYRSAFDKLRESSTQENIDLYKKLTNFADRTEKNKEYEATAHVCMSLIDSDRLLHLLDHHYQLVQLETMQPPECTTKNNLILAKYVRDVEAGC